MTQRMEAMKDDNRPEGLWLRFRRTLTRDRTPDPSLAAVMAQWAEYELIFNDILQRLNAQLARQAKYDKQIQKRLASEAETLSESVPPIEIPVAGKAALRSAYAQSRFGGRIAALTNAREMSNERIGQDREAAER